MTKMIQDGGENDFWEKSPVECTYILRVKNFVQITLSHRFRDNTFYAENQDGRKTIFLERSIGECPDILRVKDFVEIALSRTVIEINAFLRFTQKFKMAAKNGKKTIFRKTCQ